MQVLTATAWSVTWIGAVLLVVAGVAKVARPAATSETLALAGLPDRPLTARLLGLGEIAVGAVVVLTGHALAVGTLAAAYVAFAVVAWWLLRTDRGSCGCFGEVDAPLSRIHVVTDLVVAVAGVLALTAPPPVPTTVAQWLVLGLLVATGAALVRMLLVLVPALADGVRRVRPT